MKNFTLLLTVIILMLSDKINSQVHQEWAVTFGGTANNNDEAVEIAYDGQGNVVITGRAISTGNNNDFYTVKYNAAGMFQWAAVYDGVNHNYDAAIGLVIDNSGNVFVTGRTRNSSLNYDIALVKYNSAGIEQWVKIYNSSANLDDIPSDIAIDNSGNICITGYTNATSSNTNYLTLKYNSSGVLLWAKEYNSPLNNSDDAAYFIDTDANGNVYVTGTSTAQQTGSDFLTIKYNSNGDSSWVKRYSGTTASNELPKGFAVDGNGNAYVTGFTTGPSASIDFVTIKYNTSGVQQWAVNYDSTQGQDIPEDLEVDDSGNVYVTGRTRINSSYNDFATIKYNSSGIRQWIAIYDNPPESRDDYGYDVTLDPQGNVYVTGNSQADGSNRDALTIKYNSTGAQQWVARYDATNAEETYSITLDGSNNVYVTGYQGLTNSQYLTIKYSQSVGIHTISSEVPAGISLSQNYPNPFNPVTKIRFDIPANFKREVSDVRLVIYNSLGIEVSTLVSQSLSPGSYEFDFDGSRLSSGVYFYKLEVENFSDVKKMSLIK